MERINQFTLLVVMTLLGIACEQSAVVRSNSFSDLGESLQCLIRNPSLIVQIGGSNLTTEMRVRLSNASQFQNELVYSGCPGDPDGFSSLSIHSSGSTGFLTVFATHTIASPITLEISSCAGDLFLEHSSLDFEIDFRPQAVCENLYPGYVWFEAYGVQIDM